MAFLYPGQIMRKYGSFWEVQIDPGYHFSKVLAESQVSEQLRVGLPVVVSVAGEFITITAIATEEPTESTEKKNAKARAPAKDPLAPEEIRTGPPSEEKVWVQECLPLRPDIPERGNVPPDVPSVPSDAPSVPPDAPSERDNVPLDRDFDVSGLTTRPLCEETEELEQEKQEAISYYITKEYYCDNCNAEKLVVGIRPGRLIHEYYCPECKKVNMLKLTEFDAEEIRREGRKCLDLEGTPLPVTQGGLPIVGQLNASKKTLISDGQKVMDGRKKVFEVETEHSAPAPAPEPEPAPAPTIPTVPPAYEPKPVKPEKPKPKKKSSTKKKKEIKKPSFESQPLEEIKEDPFDLPPVQDSPVNLNDLEECLKKTMQILSLEEKIARWEGMTKKVYDPQSMSEEQLTEELIKEYL